MDQLQMFALNIHLLIGILVCGGCSLVLLIAVWTLMKVLRFQRTQARGEKEQQAARIGRDGKPLPPTSQGICDRCGRIFREVYHLPDGTRLCATCYVTEHREKK